ncbi:MAG: hypothetical protein JNK82_34585 [Myxococcaceae bacterium]|nr:hypothetical protein [Myxococcaceae bacterium]
MRTLLLLCLAAASACTGPTSPTGPTYSTDIAPLLADKCVRCHQQGGIGSIRLDTYEHAKNNGVAASAAVQLGVMPPFYARHDGTCGDFVDGETLTAAQKELLATWVAEGLAEGTPKEQPLTPLPHLDGARELSTPLFAPVAQGGTLAAADEYRCFPIAHGTGRDTFVTGYDLQPGDARVVHHVLGFIVDPARMSRDGMRTNAAVMQALDEQSPSRDGWPCFGQADDQGLIAIDSVPVDWAPGQGIIEYPEGMGVPLRRDQLLVLQVHYNLADPATHGATDSTKLRLRTADSVERKLAFLTPDGLLDTLFGGQPATLPPLAASTTFSWTASATKLGISSLPYVDVMAVMPHMHERGRKFELRWKDSSAGADTCGVHIDAWDFHWQRMYYYREGSLPRLTAQSSVQVTCDYDTSRDTMAVLPGWGTRNEMCLVVMMLAFPPGI